MGIWRAYTDDAYAHLAADLGAYGVPGRVEDRTDVFWWPAHRRTTDHCTKRRVRFW